MTHPRSLLLAPLAGLGLAALLPLCTQAQTIYINEDFESDTVGSAPTDGALRRALLTTVEVGAGAIGTDHVARLNDNSTGGGGALEYNVGASALGSLYVQFDLFNNAPSGTGSGTNPIIFGIGNWNDSSSTLLGANANRAFGLEFSANGSSSTLKIRVGGSAVFTSTFDMAEMQTVKVFINDHDVDTLDYLVPGTSSTATLGANSAVIFINDSLVSTESVSGFAMSTGAGSGNTTGNLTLGRLGFTTSSTTLADFSIDNILASSIPSAVPEPSAAAALAGAGILGLALGRRRRR